MKKFVALLALFCMFGLVSCGTKEKEIFQIESYEWKMQKVMSNDIELADSDVLIVAVGEHDEVYPNAKVVDLILTANNGEITLVDSTNSKTYAGSYKITEETSKTITYEIIIDGITGYAALSTEEQYDGNQIPTLPINLGEYSIYFLPDETKSN